MITFINGIEYIQDRATVVTCPNCSSGYIEPVLVDEPNLRKKVGFCVCKVCTYSWLEDVGEGAE